MRAKSALPRSLFTAHFKEYAQTATGLPVGLGGFPEGVEYGWGSVNEGAPLDEFIPYYMIAVGQATPDGGSIGDSGTEWTLNYRVTIAGVDIVQTEDVADHLRIELQKLSRISLHHERSDTDWRIMEYKCPLIGDVNKVSALQPDYYIQTDSYQVRVTKGRG